jgi:hypothetical protein
MHEPNIQIKNITLFKFCEQDSIVNIYLEQINFNQGRLIILIKNRIFQRFFDGVGNSGFVKFISEQTCSSISGCFSDVNDGEDETYDFLLKYLSPIWSNFINAIYEEFPDGFGDSYKLHIGRSGIGRSGLIIQPKFDAALILENSEREADKILKKDILQVGLIELTTMKDLNPSNSGQERRRERRKKNRRNKR